MKVSRISLMLVIAGLFTCSFFPSSSVAPESSGIKWMTWKEVQEAQKREPRKVFVDVYTDWCGWCKKMDQTTFTQPEIIRYINTHFYAVKFDAETQETIHFKEKDYRFVPSGNRGYNELAAEMLQGRMSYPTSIYMDEALNVIFPVPGYLDAKTLEQVLNFVGGNSYKSIKFDEFRDKFKGNVP